MYTCELPKQEILNRIVTAFRAENDLYSEALAREDIPQHIRDRRAGRALALSDLLRDLEVYD